MPGPTRGISTILWLENTAEIRHKRGSIRLLSSRTRTTSSDNITDVRIEDRLQFWHYTGHCTLLQTHNHSNKMYKQV